MRLVMSELLAGVHISSKEVAVQPNCHTQCWKRGFLFFIEAWIQRHQQSPRIVILKVVCRFVVLLLSTFSGFSIFTAGFLCLWQLCSLLCRPPQRSTERSRILIHRHWRQEVQLFHCLRFEETSNLLAWGDVVCEPLWAKISNLILGGIWQIWGNLLGT